MIINKNEKFAYLAGIIDGEGSFYIAQDNRHGKSFNSRLYVTNTDKELIDWLYKNFKGLTYSYNSIKNPHWKTRFQWIVQKKDILEMCENIFPYLVVKKEQAKIMIKFRKTFNQWRGRGNPVSELLHRERIDYMLNLRKLNQRCIN